MRTEVPSLKPLSGLSLNSLSGLRIWHCCACGVGRCLQCRPAPVAPIRTLAWEVPYAVDAALKKKKKNWCVGVPFVAHQLTNPTRIHEDSGSICDLVQWG